jgi:hypothetical protein
LLLFPSKLPKLLDFRFYFRESLNEVAHLAMNLKSVRRGASNRIQPETLHTTDSLTSSSQSIEESGKHSNNVLEQDPQVYLNSRQVKH